ncbi:MAG: GNAT family N-acetyltransferase [Clostridia bacterium]|nr:GNAT family N-acetyltransferase [Clostridia bacterium]
MIIRYLTKDDVVEHDKIAAQAFVSACDIRDPASVLPCEKMLGAFDDDGETMFADLEIHEKKCNYDGRLLTCAGIGGVAAKPEHRGKGAVKALFAHLFRECGYDIAVLYPFAEGYYRKLGFERVGLSVCATVPFASLSDIGRNTDVTLYEGNDTERLLAVYNRCARKYNLSFVRDDAEMFSAEPYLSEKYTYVWQNDSFATLHVDRAKSTVFADELWFDSCESMRGIVGFLRNFESNQKYVCFGNVPASSPLLHYVRELKDCDIRVRNTGSARILNIENVLKAHTYPARDGGFTIGVGCEVFHVTYSKNGVAIDKNSARAPDAVADIGTASRLLLCGFSDAEYIPGLEIRNPDSDFFRAFPPKTTFFTDNL